MRESLRTLLVDDNPDDRALVIRELKRVFPNLRAEEAADQETFSRSLDSGPCDLVITDFQLRWTDGLSILRKIKERWPDCPVIMFTGTGSEEIAVQAMKSGLDDYVLKSPKQYARLPGAAKLALKVAQQRQRLKQAELRYTVLFATVPVGLYRSTAEGEILDANPALVEMLRFPEAQALAGTNVAALYVEPAKYQDWREVMKRDGVVHNVEAQLKTRDGGVCWVETSARAIQEGAGRRTIYEACVENITHRKAAEDERERLISELQEALGKVRTLSGLLPICAACKKIRDDKGYWNQIEIFIQNHSEAEFTHSFCPECMRTLYPEVFAEREPAEERSR